MPYLKYENMQISGSENTGSYDEDMLGIKITNEIEYDNSGNIYHANGRTSVLSSHIFDVTDTSTHKCKLSALCEFAAACHSATGQSRTWVQFIRLGDT